jgi:CRISPR-associated protein Cas1
MGTVYVNQEDAFLGRSDERLKITHERRTLLEVPLLKVDGIVVLGRAHFSPALMGELLERQIPMSFLSATGRYLGRLEPELTKNIFVRSAQWRASEQPERILHLARAFVRGKLKNCRNDLMRAQREHSGLELQKAIDSIQQSIHALPRAETVDGVRGFEGAGSAAYFGAFDQLIRVEGFSFAQRSRRPPLDAVNALLSFGYSLLRHDIQSALNIVGFDPYLGYLHTQRYGRPSLALDMMEEFRPLVVDAMVLCCLNKSILRPEDFESEPLSGAVSLNLEARKQFLRQYEQKKQSRFRHPVLEKQCTYQEAFEIQARLLGKYLLAETEQYPPLILK